MIQTDQPDFLPKDIVVRFSSRSDGTMLDRTRDIHDPALVAARREFCQQNGVNYDDVVYQRIVYSESMTYDTIVEVDERSVTASRRDVEADALCTKKMNVGLFLPVADCVATVLYDPTQRFLAVLHLGRHSTMTDLLPQVIQRFIEAGSQTTDMVVWMSPSAGREHYKLEYFTQRNEPKWRAFYDERPDGIYIDIAGYNRQRFLDAGLLDTNIHVSTVDTMSDDNYFSHAKGDTHGRMALLAMMRET